jgi:hypothetical protein
MTDEQIARIADGSTPHPGPYVKCLFDGDEPKPWPMFSRSAELARVLHESVVRP